MCLFHVLLQLQAELDITIHPVHVNHQFRPGAAEEDQKFVEEFCFEQGMTCSTFVVDCNSIAKEQGISGEEAGRNARYKAFYQVGRSVMAENGIGPEQVKIVVAQNANDQAETLLMRILRGTGPDGLAGIEYKREGEDEIEIIRPLLDIKRKDIEQYCEENRLAPRFDHTNEQPIYTRNKIRLQLIPFLEKNFNPNITETINRLASIAKEDKDFMEAIVADLLKGNGGEKNAINLDLLRKQHPAIRKRIILKKLEGIGLEQGIGRAHLEAADKLILEGKLGAIIHLPKGYRVLIGEEEVGFIKEKIDTRETDRVDNRLVSQPNRLNGLVLRTRQPGDYIVLKGVGGRKKIQDLFVDMKIKKELRDHIPMLCQGNQVMWILGDDITGLETGMKKGRISEGHPLEEETIKRIFVEYNKKL